MTHKEKIAYLLNDLSGKGIGKYTIAPPAYRLAWQLGIEITPPHFAPFWSLMVFLGTSFAIVVGLLWFVLGNSIPIATAIDALAVKGFLLES